MKVPSDIAALRPAVLCLAIAAGLSGCVSTPFTSGPDSEMLLEALKGTGVQRPPAYLSSEQPPIMSKTADNRNAMAQQVIKGTQRFVRSTPVELIAQQAPHTNNSDDLNGGIVFNFANQPIQAVVNSVMGDLLHENYSIADGVEGDVSFSTSKPVDRLQALSILETLLSWTNNAMIRQGSSYVIMPASQAIRGNIFPQISMPQPMAGLSARLFPLRYISAIEMQKLLKPFTRENALLLVDPARNLLSLAGTPDELANYQSTIDTFDVDWLKGMSVGIFGLQHASVGELMPELQKIFGPVSGLPLAGMVRFLPVERTNTIVAFSSQPRYLDEVGNWIRTIDEGDGNELQMYVYDVRNMKATDLARYLRQMYGGDAINDDAAAKVAPGLRANSLSSQVNGDSSTGESTSIMDGGIRDSRIPGDMADQQALASDTEATMVEDQESSNDYFVSQDSGKSVKSLMASARISAQKNSNQLLVRTRPAQWKEIETAIQRLDTPPLQVQIETRILEVKLTGELHQGVQWYLGRLAGNAKSTTVANTPGIQGALGAGGAGLASTDSLFYSFVSNKLQIAIHALETSGLTQVLSAPSLVVMNNQKAQIQVGENIPVSQTTVNAGTSDTSLSSVEYLQTGIILKVVPRINSEGLVYMDIQQQVSEADFTGLVNGNPRISTRSVATQVIAQSGQTILLGGLIKQGNSLNTSDVPFLSRLPGVRWLFGLNNKTKNRTELLVLITPRIVNGSNQARQLTDDYRQQMIFLHSGKK
ncbi:type II secretion system secretin GspD [Pseudomonas syringae group genomosp. 7]|uniref:type II secretion system secretin GspD n=1 Tax=Pseudomonas syringae group genomosp. 7 TaxID=251699 RepID=UPI0006D648F4|nr:type II secretion system secretin GspD [Pseudomonas syringae group genomosp. 7]UNB61764.1 type II secretion system secretin GspD [Pseudomonas syringae pv. helianthi]